jgi:hypothetical protein
VHQCCKNGKELTGWYLTWIKEAASQFRRDTTTSSSSDDTVNGAGNLTTPLTAIFTSLPPTQQETLLPILDAHSKYLDQMHASSKTRLETLLKSPPSKNPTIAKLLSSSNNNSRPSSRAASPDRGNSGRLTPVPVPTISDNSGLKMDPGPGAYLARWQDLLDGTPITPLSPTGSAGGKEGDSKDLDSGKPDVRPVIEALGKQFRAMLGNRGVYW